MKERTKQEIYEYSKMLRLSSIAENFESALEMDMSPEDYLLKLLMIEQDARDHRLIERRIKAAKFPCRKYLEDLEINCLPEGMQKKLPEIKTLDFIRNGQNIIMTGNPGTGKTHTAIGLGIKACEAGYKVLYTTIPLLITELKESNDRQKLRAYQRKFERYDLVIADELGYVSFDKAGADLLFNNLSLRASTKSTIITSNLTFDRWDEVFGDAALTSAMVDRLTYKALLIDMEGDSYRFRETLKENGASFEYLKEVQKNAE